MQNKISKPQFFAVVFNGGESVITSKPVATPKEALLNVAKKIDGRKVSMFKGLGSKKQIVNKFELLENSKGWVNNFNKPFSASEAKFKLAWLKTALFKDYEVDADDDDKARWCKAKVWSVEGLSKAAKKNLKVGQIVKMSFFRMPTWVDELEAHDGRDDANAPKIVAVVQTKKGNFIVNGFTAHVL